VTAVGTLHATCDSVCIEHFVKIPHSMRRAERQVLDVGVPCSVPEQLISVFVNQTDRPYLWLAAQNVHKIGK